MKGFYALVDVKDDEAVKTYVVGECKSRLDAEYQANDFISTRGYENATISGIYVEK